jgi:uncharacterized protein YbjT (DUF2867 family)
MIVVTGATSNTGRSVAAALLNAGAKIRVIGRTLDRLKPFVDRGAEPFVADPTDAEAIAPAFRGATAAYVMLQPGYLPDSTDFPAYQQKILDAVVPRLAPSGLSHVVALSGWGANYPESTGPLLGLRRLEARLAASGVPNVVNLRAGWFMENAEPIIDELRNGTDAHGALRGDLKLPMIATEDVGKVAARFLLDRDFSGHDTKEVQGPEELTLQQASEIVARLLGRSEARYVQLSPDSVRAGLLHAGFTPHMADAFVDVSADVNDERIRMLRPVGERIVTATRFEEFARSVLAGKERA